MICSNQAVIHTSSTNRWPNITRRCRDDVLRWCRKDAFLSVTPCLELSWKWCDISLSGTSIVCPKSIFSSSSLWECLCHRMCHLQHRHDGWKKQRQSSRLKWHSEDTVRHSCCFCVMHRSSYSWLWSSVTSWLLSRNSLVAEWLETSTEIDARTCHRPVLWWSPRYTSSLPFCILRDEVEGKAWGLSFLYSLSWEELRSEKKSICKSGFLLLYSF